MASEDPVGPPRPSCAFRPELCVPACFPARTAWQRRALPQGKAKWWTPSGRERAREGGWGLRQTGLCSGSLRGLYLEGAQHGPWSPRRWEHTASSWLHGVPADMKPLTRRGPHLPGASLAGEAQQPQLRLRCLLPERRGQRRFSRGGWGRWLQPSTCQTRVPWLRCHL